MTCKGICKQYKGMKDGTKSWYLTAVRCSRCVTEYISFDGTVDSKKLRCKCCNMNVRTSSRNINQKQRTKHAQKLKLVARY